MAAFTVQAEQHGMRLMRAADSCRSWWVGRLTYQRQRAPATQPPHGIADALSAAAQPATASAGFIKHQLFQHR